MVTSEQVARLAGVSRATVSRALNDSAHVSEETKQRVYNAISALGYEPDVVAQSLARQRSRTIALSLFDIDQASALSQLGKTQHYFYLDILKHIERAAAAANYDLLLPSPPLVDGQQNYVRSLQTRRIAGVLTLSLDPADVRVQALLKTAIPTVFIDSPGQGLHATYVTSDHIDGSRLAIRHLLSLGHYHIAVLPGGNTGSLTSAERLLGCQQALAHAGLALKPGLVRQSGWNTEDAYQATRLLLSERRDFTAIVAGSDLMALGVLRALHEEGLRIPEDVSVVGFDDVDLSKYTEPPLTTVRQDREIIGLSAIQQLISMIEIEQFQLVPIVVPTRLVVRASTGPARILLQ